MFRFVFIDAGTWDAPFFFADTKYQIAAVAIRELLTRIETIVMIQVV